MQRAIQTEINLQKMAVLDRKIHYGKLNIKQKPSRKGNRASKSIKKYFIEKEQGWNDSFVYDRIPAVFESPIINSKKLYRKKSETSNIISIAEPRRNAPSELRFRIQRVSTPHSNNLYSVRSMPSHYKPGKIKPETSFKQMIINLEDNISKIYQLKQIPKCHIDIVQQIKSSLEDDAEYIKLLKQQLKDLKSPSSKIHSVKTACETRQNLLLTIKQIIQLAKISPKQNFNKTKNLPDMLRQLRNHSLNCIEKIFKWKELLLQFQKQLNKKIEIKFVYSEAHDENYLMNILYDTEFLFESGMFNGSSFPDPFFLSYQQQFVMEMKKYSKIRACELFLLEQSL